MPQLNPGPWFLIMLLTWIALMAIFLNKTLTTTHPNTPIETKSEEKHPPSWTWPWY